MTYVYTQVTTDPSHKILTDKTEYTINSDLIPNSIPTSQLHMNMQIYGNETIRITTQS